MTNKGQEERAWVPGWLPKVVDFAAAASWHSCLQASTKQRPVSALSPVEFAFLTREPRLPKNHNQIGKPKTHN